MAKATGIGGLFLRADDPGTLKSWYQTHLGIDMSMGAWIQDEGPTVFQPFERDNDYFPEDRAVMLNFRVDDLATLCDNLRTAGIDIMTDPAWNSEIGTFARIHDPEGNPIELWEPAGPAAET